jgi:ariadne-1
METTQPSPSPLKKGFSILRRSSAVLQRRSSRDFSQEEPRTKICTITDVPHVCRRRLSININVGSAPQSSSSSNIPIRRNSISIVRRPHKPDLQAGFSLPRSLGISRSFLHSVKEEEELQHDFQLNEEIDSLSSCSETPDVADVDIDPSDWFLEEEMEEEPKFVILEKEELEQRQDDSIDTIAAHLNISRENAALVLQYFSWDTELLLRVYFDRPEFYLQAAGLILACTSSSIQQSSLLRSPSMTCPVCFEEKPIDCMVALGCLHYYCASCWREYIHQAALSSGREIINTTCMHPHCTAKLTFNMFERLADPHDNDRYRYFLLKHFAEANPNIVHCPNPSCGNAVLYQGDGCPTDVVECHCGTRFCFSCGHEKHNPITCTQLDQWIALLQDDSESVAVIKATSKACYHCGIPTERITGCNHMICRKETGGCGGEWCWMCRGDWSTHGAHTGGFYSCNKYEQSGAKKVDEESMNYLQSSKRLLHYFNRYFNHDLLMKDIQQMLKSGEVEQKIRDFLDITGCCTDFYMEAAELLVECRRMLKYTYVYGYYLEDCPAKALFEYQQASAEGVTERLSELFHAPVEIVAQSPLDFVNYVRVAKKYISNLIRSIEEGTTVENVPISQHAQC